VAAINSEASPEFASPNPARFLIIAVASMSAMLMYLDRVCIAIMGTTIQLDLGLADWQWSWALGAFFLAYAVGQVPAGRLADQFGPRRMLALNILAWSACTAATGLVNGFVLLLAARLACGLSQAGAYPSSAVLLRRWVAPPERATANSMVTLGGRLGAVVAPWITALLIVACASSGQPSHIGPADLLQAAKLGRDLTSVEKSPLTSLRDEIRTRLDTTVLSSAHRLANGTHEPADLESLRTGLNRLISGPSMADSLANSRSVLPAEALAALDNAPNRLTEIQSQRFNRLALEAASPKALRPLYASGWRPVLWLYGTLGIFVAVLSWSVIRERPPTPVAEPGTTQVVSATGLEQGRKHIATEERRTTIRRLVLSQNLWFK
jgi:ACS family glucarate transporter-like MFS transporter